MLINSYRFATAAPWTPAQITTALWLDASDAATISPSGGPVSQWNDKSGNGRHATQTNAALRPIYTSNSVVFSFDRLNIPAAAWPTYDYSMAVVIQSPGSATAGAGLININTTNPASNPELRLAITGYNNPIYYNSAYVIQPNFAPLANKSILCLEMSAGIKSELFGNGTSLGTGTRAGTLSPTSTFELGYFTGTNSHANGTIWRLLVYPTSTDNRQRIEGWMAHQEGLTSLLPADHPYKSAAPTV